VEKDDSNVAVRASVMPGAAGFLLTPREMSGPEPVPFWIGKEDWLIITPHWKKLIMLGKLVIK
jgi:hypothetical protein